MDIRQPEEQIAEKVPVKKKNKINKLVAVAIAAGVLATAGWFQFGSSSLPWFKNNLNSREEISYLIPMKEFQVNLADKGARRYIRLKIYFGSNDKALIKEIERREPELRSCIITILRSTSVSELDGQDGMNRLKATISEQVNALVFSGKIEDIFFDEFIIQLSEGMAWNRVKPKKRAFLKLTREGK